VTCTNLALDGTWDWRWRARFRRYPSGMLRTLRAESGGPAFRTRIVAGLLALGLLLSAAPLLIPITRWAVGTVAPRRGRTA